jgi:hypothetical protein
MALEARVRVINIHVDTVLCWRMKHMFIFDMAMMLLQFRDVC